MILVAVDPGVCQGWARFVGKELFSCGRGDPPFGSDTVAPPTDVIIEKPEHRQHERRPIRVNDLITLGIRVGRLAERARCADVRLVTPTDWKAGVSKERHHPRILAALTERERDIAMRGAQRPKAKEPDDNVIDAVGLGLWALGRIGRGGA